MVRGFNWVEGSRLLLGCVQQPSAALWSVDVPPPPTHTHTNPDPPTPSTCAVSGETFLRKLLSMPIEASKFDIGRPDMWVPVEGPTC